MAVTLITAAFAGCNAKDGVSSVTTTEAPIATVDSTEETTAPPPVDTTTEAPVQATQEQAKPNETKAQTTDASIAPPISTEVKITKDEAKEIVLTHAKLSSTDISRYKMELDREHSVLVYEIEFDYGKYEYDYEVNADSGKIIKSEKELRD